jgi:hypothetical protein
VYKQQGRVVPIGVVSMLIHGNIHLGINL